MAAVIVRITTASKRQGKDNVMYRKVYDRREQSEREQYEKYIEKVSWNYVEAAGDDGWGGFASRDMARRNHSFEDWKRMKG